MVAEFVQEREKMLREFGFDRDIAALIRAKRLGPDRDTNPRCWPHDIIITVGVYAASRFEVTPATIIGVLTIFGYSLYDTMNILEPEKKA